jgi:uncharacterized protein (TIGR02391 family)
VPQAVALLENLIKRLEEKRADLGGDSISRVRASFQGLDLHPRIAAASSDLYRNGHYRNAVLDASLALVSLVKEKSGRHDLDGAGLMTTVFSKNKPALVFNDLKDKTDEDEQEGMMHLFVGAVLALRNTRAHALLDDRPETAIEYIALISLLAKKVDQARKSPDTPGRAVPSGQASTRRAMHERETVKAETCPRCHQASWRLEDSKPDPTFGVLGVVRRMYRCSGCGLSEPKLSP